MNAIVGYVEVDAQVAWQRATLGIATVGRDVAAVDASLFWAARQHIEGCLEVEIIGWQSDSV